jgi:outer membrane biosynthesis protein TonB
MHRRSFLLSTLSFALLFAFACNKPTDDAITTQIKAKMFSEPLLKSASVNVASKNSIVTLTGVVPDDAARLAAQTIASQAKGVKQVIDSTTMAPPPPAYPAADALPPAPPEPAPRARKSSSRKDRSNQSAAAEPEPPPAPATPPAPEPASAAANQPGPITPAPASAAPAPPPPPPPPQPVTATIPEGSVLTIRTIDSIDSATSSTGKIFRGSLDEPVVVDDRVVLPKGLNVKLKLVESSSAGKIKGQSQLTVSLETTYQGKTYTLSSSDVQQKGASRGKRSAAVIGGGTVLGALVGGLAGGGKGAAIGAGVGAGTGTAVQVMTKGEQVKIPAETRLDFTLHAPVAVTYLPSKKPFRARPASPDQTPPADPVETQPATPPDTPQANPPANP